MRGECGCVGIGSDVGGVGVGGGGGGGGSDGTGGVYDGVVIRMGLLLQLLLLVLLLVMAGAWMSFSVHIVRLNIQMKSSAGMAAGLNL
ncbi:Hypothetical predicted protein [Octopus vulgaris]|uniref:Uncharacterized protein n=1 Tax=Octopus vulgaris TaxID=6645 RepID=A0AA36EYF2_OCTVU|nr:Hypothetical predicted protein [Octopus vulgaris]